MAAHASASTKSGNNLSHVIYPDVRRLRHSHGRFSMSEEPAPVADMHGGTDASGRFLCHKRDGRPGAISPTTVIGSSNSESVRVRIRLSAPICRSEI